MLLTFTINKQLIRRTDCEIPVAKSENYLYAQFSFSEEWVGTKTAIFNNGTPYSVQLDEDNKCLVPWEVITASGFSVSVFCGQRITANVEFVGVLPTGYIEGQTPEPPTPTVYEQIIEELEGKLEPENIIAGDNITITVNGKNVTISSTGGSSVQVDEVTLTDDNGTLKVKSGGIDTTQIKDSAVTSDKLATDSVTFTKIKNGQVTEEKLQTACVTTGKIADAAITSGKLAQKSVTWQKLADSVTGVISSKQNVLTAGAGISISNDVISATASITFTVVQELPETGNTQTIYLISNGGTTPNIYDEYIYVNNAWEKIGTTEVDLSNYYTKTETNTLLNAKADTSALASKLDTNQGSANVGKVMTVGNDGSLTPENIDIPSVVQTTGQSTVDVMSQKAVTDAINGHTLVVQNIWDGTYKSGVFIKASNGQEESHGSTGATYFIDVSNYVEIETVFGTSQPYQMAFYDENENYVTGYSIDGTAYHIWAINVPPNAHYARLSFYLSEVSSFFVRATRYEGIVIDNAMSDASNNAVANRTIKAYVDNGLSSKQNAPLVFSNLSVASSDWVADSTYSGLGYKAVLTCTGVTASMQADVYLSSASASLNIVAPFCDEGTDSVTIYATSNDAITIDKVVAI